MADGEQPYRNKNVPDAPGAYVEVLGRDFGVLPGSQKSQAKIPDPPFNAFIVRRLSDPEDFRRGGMAELIPEAAKPGGAAGPGPGEIPGLQTEVSGTVILRGILKGEIIEGLRETSEAQVKVPDAGTFGDPAVFIPDLKREVSGGQSLINQDGEIRRTDALRRDAPEKVIRKRRALFGIIPESFQKALPAMGKGDHEIRCDAVYAVSRAVIFAGIFAGIPAVAFAPDLILNKTPAAGAGHGERPDAGRNDSS
jgi:hypothetical protein